MPSLRSRPSAFADWTAEELVLCNFLRPIPLPTIDLTRYAGHRQSSLVSTATALRRDGRLSPDNQVITDHPANLALTSRDRLFPLPAVPTRAATIAARDVSAAAALADLSTASPADTTLSREKAAAILARYITTGAAGRDTPAFIARWAEFDIARSPGPPAPTDHRSFCHRVLAFLLALPPHTVRSAYRLWLASPLPPTPAIPTVLPQPTPPHREPALDSPSPGEAPPPPSGHLEGQDQPTQEVPSPDNLREWDGDGDPPFGP